MKKLIWTCLAAAIAVCLAGSAVAEDLTITSKVSSERNPDGTAVSYLSADHVRIAEPDGNEFIVDFKSGKMISLNGQKKTYFVTTREEMEKFAADLKAKMDTPEMKKMQEQMKGMMGAIDTTFEMKNTGVTRRIAGYPCEVWDINIGQFSRSEECVSGELHFPPQAWDMYRGLAASMKSMMAAMGPMAKGMEQMQEKMKNMKGYPLSRTMTISVMNHSMKTLSEVIDVKKGPIPSSVWEIPAGYSKAENPMLKAFSKSR